MFSLWSIEKNMPGRKTVVGQKVESGLVSKLLAGTQRVWEEKLDKAWLNSECGLGDLGESPGS